LHGRVPVILGFHTKEFRKAFYVLCVASNMQT
jgi:hypothetical protein